MTYIPAFNIFNPDAPPLVPHACDDEFTSGSLDPKWTEWDVDGHMTVTIDTVRQVAKMVGSGNALADRWAGIYQAVPGSEYAFVAKMCPVAIREQYHTWGMFMTNGTPSNNNLIAGIHVTVDSTTFNVLARRWTDYNGPVAAEFGQLAQIQLFTYGRIRVNGSNASYDVSSDGMFWTQIASAAIGFTPSHFGVGINPVNAGITVNLLVPFVRVFEGAGTSARDATYIGRRI